MRPSVPSNFMANQRVPKFSLNICAQSPKKMFVCPKFQTNPVLKYTKCHISTNLSSFLKLCLLYCQKYLHLLEQIADSLKKIGLVRTLVQPIQWRYISASIYGKYAKQNKPNYIFNQICKTENDTCQIAH